MQMPQGAGFLPPDIDQCLADVHKILFPEGNNAWRQLYLSMLKSDGELNVHGEHSGLDFSLRPVMKGRFGHRNHEFSRCSNVRGIEGLGEDVM